MRFVKILVGLSILYISIVILFEAFIGYFQPTYAATLTMITTDDEGVSKSRVLQKLDVDDKVYVAVNHWPRAWYYRALSNPNVEVIIDDVKGDYVVVPVTGAEQARVDSAQPLPMSFRVLTGFPPRFILRLDPSLGMPD